MDTEKENTINNLILQINSNNPIYESINIGTLIFHSKNHFQNKIPFCLEDFFYRMFCSQINQEFFVKAIVQLYGNTFIHMFNVELYNCIGSYSDNSPKKRVICDALQDMNDKLNISFQNIKLLKQTEKTEDQNMYETELNYGGLNLPLGKDLVRYHFKHKLFKAYQLQLELFFEEKIKNKFKKYDVDSISNMYKDIFNFQKKDNIYLHQQDINNIVNVFLSTSIKKKSKGVFLSGGKENGNGNVDCNSC